ncbi:MAG: lipid IV(A) 3-deoxy-D-manno-octulosonic acid transferase [Burkholderiaceae bacterium]
MRALYSLAWWIALPLVLARLWWRGRKEPGYRQHWAERLSFYQGRAFNRAITPVIWIHAVSVGETRAAEPLLEALLSAYPTHTILLTHMTPTGRTAGKALFGKYAPRVLQCYLPYDTGWMVGRFLQHFAPRLCILMETEVWPNAVAQCAKHQIPVALVNARLSERSLAKAHRLSSLITDAAKQLTCVAAQTKSDAARLKQLGTNKVYVTGSIKFDVTPPDAALRNGAELRAQIGTRPVLLCASTREGEEALILDALKSMPPSDALIVIVPRHPQRFDEVARMIAARELPMCRRSTLGSAAIAPEIRIMLGDSMGEMFTYYAACDIAFIGGSLMPLGGQNLIEACALGKPVLLGPYTFNFSVVSEDAIEAGAALRVQDAPTMLQEAMRLLHPDSPHAGMGEQAKIFAELHRGATSRTMALLRPLLD